MYAAPVIAPQGVLMGPGADLPSGQPGHLVRGFWSDGVCSCFDSCGICCMSLFCPCIRFAQSVSRVALLPFNTALLMFLSLVVFHIIMMSINEYYAIHYGTAFNWAFYFTIIGDLATVILAAYYRTKIRQLYDIPGSGFEDFCCHFWCSPCALSQEARHIDRDFALPV